MDKQNLNGSDVGVQHSQSLGFLDFAHRPELFPSSDEVRETPTLLDPLPHTKNISSTNISHTEERQQHTNS
jgi:hypothetical protein